MVIAFCLCAILALETVDLTWSASMMETSSIVVHSLHVAFVLYLLAVTLYSLPQAGINAHTHTVVHMSILTFLSAFLLGTTAIIPGSYHVTLTGSPTTAFKALWYTVLALYAISAAVALTTPLGPLLHYPVRRIYDEKTVSQVTNTDIDNVCGVVSASVLGTLLFSYTTKVVMLGNVAESLEIGDLVWRLAFLETLLLTSPRSAHRPGRHAREHDLRDHEDHHAHGSPQDPQLDAEAGQWHGARVAPRRAQSPRHDHPAHARSRVRRHLLRAGPVPASPSAVPPGRPERYEQGLGLVLLGRAVR
jgi:hypothetical protein